MRPRAPGVPLLGLLSALALGCSAAPPAPPPPLPVPARPAAGLLSPARYLVAEPVVIELREDGIEHAVVNGRRLALRGPEIVSVGPADPDLDGGGRAPVWSIGGAGAAGGAAPARYVFWKGKRLWGSETFLGPLHPLGALPQDPLRSFDWLTGTGLAIPGGALAAPPSGGAPARLGVAGVSNAVAADAHRALVITVLGHAWLTVDGGASYRDVSADLGVVAGLFVQDGAIVATASDGRERVVTAAGTIVDREPSGHRPGRPLPDPDPFADAAGQRPLEIALRSGLPLGDGGVVVAERGFVGRFDLATLRATSVAPLDAGLHDAECTPLRAGGAVLLACVGPERAAVVDLEGAPRTERSFDLAGASDLTRFVVGDDALGFLGPCDGTPPRVPEHDRDRDRGGDPSNASRQQSPVFCVRAGKDEWVEYQLAPGEVEDVLAWIPRASGGAVAVLSRPGPFLDDRERVQVRGALRVVRLARSEPPLALGPYGAQRDGNVDDSLRALADDTISGWIAGTGGSGGDLSVTIDAAGHVRPHGAPPYVSQIARAGALALAGGDDGRLWESVDAGQRWTEVERPPAVLRAGAARPTACSPAGCQVGGFFRLGWSGPGAPAATPPPVDLPPGERSPRERYRRPLPSPPVVRLACTPAGPPEGRRIADSMGFGYTKEPRPRTGVARLGALGTALVPWSGAPQMPATGEIEVGWVAPLDVTGTIRRQTFPFARLGLAPSTHRIYDLRLGYLLTPEGGLSTFAVGASPGAECFARLLELAGIARPLGACAVDRAVGVDLGGRVVVVSAAWNGLHVSVAETPRLPGGGARPVREGAAVPVALHELHTTSAGQVRGFSFAVGARAGAPVVVVVDAAGQAALAPIDPRRGTFGAEEPLRPLFEASLGSSPACAPRPGEARVVLPFDGLLAIDRASIRGISPSPSTPSAGVAVLRWSRDRACLDAVELPVHDDRFDENPGPYEPSGVLRKIVARFDGKGQATLLLVGPGTETRQSLSCSALLPGGGEGP